MPIDYKKYPKNWLSEIRPRILKRDENRCNFCRVPNYAVGWRENGQFVPIGGNVTLDLAGQGLSYPSLKPLSYKEACQIRDFETDSYEAKLIVVVLTVAHLDHDEENHEVKDERLAALCQRCHLNYDILEKRERRKAKKGQMELF